mgnify:CR=1 FL=1
MEVLGLVELGVVPIPGQQLLVGPLLGDHPVPDHQNAAGATPFLSPREQAMAQSLLTAAGVRDGFLSDGCGWRSEPWRGGGR